MGTSLGTPRFFQLTICAILLSIAAPVIIGTTAEGSTKPTNSIFESNQELPPTLSDYILDQAELLSPEQESQLRDTLRQFEDLTSNQLVVILIRDVPENMVMEDFTQQAAEAWGIGQSDKDNGVAMFVFPESRQTRIEVGYGLEGALPDALANRIIQTEMIPSFQNGNYFTGINQGVQAIMSATKGEYRAESPDRKQKAPFTVILVIIIGTIAIFWMALLAILESLAESEKAQEEMSSSDGSQHNTGKTSSPRTRRSFSRGGGRFGGGGSSGRW